jgi:hypothetical protein
VKRRSDAQRRDKDVKKIIVNAALRGWASYFLTGKAEWKFRQLDRYLCTRVKRRMVRDGGQRTGRAKR